MSSHFTLQYFGRRFLLNDFPIKATCCKYCKAIFVGHDICTCFEKEDESIVRKIKSKIKRNRQNIHNILFIVIIGLYLFFCFIFVVQ